LSDDAFVEAARRALHERFGIAHATLQRSRAPLGDACVTRDAPPISSPPHPQPRDASSLRPGT
jgi:hypothetical protein